MTSDTDPLLPSHPGRPATARSRPTGGTPPAGGNAVTTVAPARPADALAHYSALLSLETDCWDVQAALAEPDGPGFVLLDVRGRDAWTAGHIDGAVHLPHDRIDEETVAPYRPDELAVVYCAGPHCNGADRAAARLAGLGRPVKKMIGGVQGWLDEGFDLVAGQPRTGTS